MIYSRYLAVAAACFALAGCGLSEEDIRDRRSAAEDIGSALNARFNRPCVVEYGETLSSFVFHVSELDWDGMTDGAQNIYVNQCFQESETKSAERGFDTPGVTIMVNNVIRAIKNRKESTISKWDE